MGLSASRSQETRESPGLAARQAAAKLLFQVLGEKRPLDAILDASGSPLAGLPAGAYLLVVDIDGDRQVKRVVKSR